MKKNHARGDGPIPEFSKLGLQSQRRRSKLENFEKVDMVEVLRRRLLSITVGVVVYLLVEERESIQRKYERANDLVDLMHIFLLVTFLVSLAPISQLLWDCIALTLHWIFSGGFWLKGRQSNWCKRMIGAMHGCVGLYGYFLARFGSGMWRDLEEKSSCLVRWRGSADSGPPCEYHILRITVGLERKFCEESSPVCSKLVFLGPYMLLGGLLTLIGALVTMEYIGCYDSNFIEGGDTSRIGNINPQTLRFPSKDQKEVDAGDVPDPE